MYRKAISFFQYFTVGTSLCNFAPYRRPINRTFSQVSKTSYKGRNQFSISQLSKYNDVSSGYLIKSCSEILRNKNVSSREINECIQILQRTLKKLGESNSTNVNIIDALMTAYAKNKQYDKAIELYQKFHSVHNEMTHLLAINACKSSRNYDVGRKIISKNINYSDPNNEYSIKLLNTLISFYGSFNFVETAENVFKSIPMTKRNTITMNAMMSCYLNNNLNKKCISFYQQQKSQVELDATSHLSAIRASANMKNYEFGHDTIQKHVDYKNKSYSVQLLTALIDFYSKSNDTKSAQNVFDSIFVNKRDVACIGAMMKMYFGNREYEKVLSIHQKHYWIHNDMTNIIALKAGQKVGNYDYGKQFIHDRIDVYNKAHSLQLKTTLINFYGHCGDVTSAQNVFASIPIKQVSVHSIGALMKAFISNQLSENAISLYKNAQSLKDETMHLLAIKAMIKINDYGGCEAIIDSLDLNKCNINLLNTVLAFYGHVGKIEQAKNIFDGILASKRDAFSITTMMNGYCRNGLNVECVKLFKETLDERENMINAVMIHIVLKACIHETLIEDGRFIYSYLKQHNSLFSNIDIRCNLICLFGKANDLSVCEKIFDQGKCKNNDVKIWNAMLNAYTRNGEIDKVIEVWEKMEEANVCLDGNTIMYLLAACNVSRDVSTDNEIESKLNEYALDERHYNECFMDDLSEWSRRRVLDTLNAFVLLLGINRKRLDRFDEEYHLMGNGPVSQLSNGNQIYIKEIISRIYRNSSDQNTHDIQLLIHKLQNPPCKLSQSEYLCIMNAHGVLENMDQMMVILSSSDFKMNNEILMSLLRHLNRNGDNGNIEEAWNHIKESNLRLNPSSLKLLILCVNKTNNDSLLSELWHFVRNESRTTLNMDCLCLFISSLSKSNDSNSQNTAHKLLSEYESDQNMQSFLQKNDSKFNQILISYGNIGQLDKMLSFYNQFMSKYKDNKHNIDSLMILASVQTTDTIKEILNIIEKEIDSNRQISINQIIGFHRIAIKYGHDTLQQKVWSILQKIDQNKKIKQNVVAKFKLNDKLYSIPNGYDVGECSFDSNKKVDTLMKTINFETNTSICPELPSEEAKICHLKSHAEKRALAILIMDDPNDKDINIKVNMRMCADCHAFYCQISKHYTQCNIQCIDPKGIHQFKNGVCTLCHG